jgi:hypothetical protein
MGKHINFFGYSLWRGDDTHPESEEEQVPTKPLYSPTVLAAYSIFTGLFVGIILYGINISRRGYVWRGRVLIVLSGLIRVLSIFFPTLRQLTTSPWSLLLSTLVAISLYTTEKPHFKRAMRNGGKPARWWLPLIWIAVIYGIWLLLQIFLIYLVYFM